MAQSEQDGERPRQLITSALPYINGVKHLGNLIGSMLPADVYARHRRACGDEVLFICATDEHGTPAELAAEEAGQSPEQFCKEQYEVQRDLYERYDLSFDHFGRTSNPQNHELTQRLARELTKKVSKQGEAHLTLRDRLDDYLLHPFWGYVFLVGVLALFLSVV